MQPSPTPHPLWTRLAADLPKTAEAYLEALAGLVAERKFDAAEAGFAAATTLFPGHPAVAARHARLAEARADWPEAVRRWESAYARFPKNPVVIQAVAAAWTRTGQASKADTLLAETLAPTEGQANRATNAQVRRMLIDRARIANSRRDFAAAAALWQELQRVAPDDPVVRNGMLEMQTLERLEAVDAGVDGPMPAPAPGQETPHSELLMRFEGLGGTCEFGLVQRYYGAEPLGLFRWVTLSADHLRDAIADNFAGIGDAEYTALGVSAGNTFYTNDSRYGLAMQTFIRNGGQEQGPLLTQLQRRMRFLRGKLLEDVQAAEKIFVYRCRQRSQNDDLLGVAAALRAHNPANRLLAIRMLPHGADGELPTWLAPGVLCGAIGDGRKAGSGSGWAINYAFWLHTVQQAATLFDAESQE